jgi:glycosyltransferase involved in cell wall biosynthesis
LRTLTIEAGLAELTVVVPVRDRNESLRRAVASVLSQSDRLCVVIVDDGSVPEFAAVADELAAAGGPGVQVVHQVNGGPAAARNAGLRVARTPYVMFLDSDDELAGKAFAAIAENLLNRHEVGLVCGAVRVEFPGGETRIEVPIAFPGVPWADLSGLSGSFAVRTEIARAVGGYDETLSFGENTDFILRVADECRRSGFEVANTNSVLSIYHRTTSDDRRYDARRLDAAMHLLERGRFDLELPSERAKLHAIAAVTAARLGRYRLSVRHAALAALTEPRRLRHYARLALSLCGPPGRSRWLRR